MSGLVHLRSEPEPDAASSVELSDDLREFAGARSLEEIVRKAREVVSDPAYPTARAWTRGGGRAVGSFPVYTPQELVHAMGMLPVSLHGGGENLEISHADAALGSFLCSVSKSTLELGLTGRLAPFSALVFPYICDVSRNLEGIFPRLVPGCATFMLHLPQNFATPAAVPFLVEEYRRLAERLERAGGVPLSPERLRRSIALFDRQRELFRRLAAARAEPHPKVSLVESYLLRRLGGLLPRELHVELLERALAEIAGRPRPVRDAVRVALVGPFCEQPTLELLELAEQVGFDVVDDDLLQAHRWYSRVPDDPDPLRGLARAYLEAGLDIGVRATPTTKAEAIRGRVRATGAQAVVFLTAKFCEPALEDVVLYRTALDTAKVPYLHLEFEERSTAYEQTRLQLETFAESILFD